MRKYEIIFNCVMRREERQIGGVVVYVIGGEGDSWERVVDIIEMVRGLLEHLMYAWS